MDLFHREYNGDWELSLPGAEVHYYPNFFSEETANIYFQQLQNETQWQQDTITVFGKKYIQPRLTALYGIAEKSYTYSGITMHPKVFTPLLNEIKVKTELVSKTTFTSVLLNLYRDGQDSNGWHSDDEKELGVNPVIASLSFGAPRVFHFRHRMERLRKFKLVLEHGSLLLMKGATQHNWQHQLPKSKKIIQPRINLTFRSIL